MIIRVVAPLASLDVYLCDVLRESTVKSNVIDVFFSFRSHRTTYDTSEGAR
jgi:hypothetical protein